MRIGLEAGAKPRCGNRSRERQPRNQTPLPRIYLLCTRPRESCSAPSILGGVIGKDALKAVQ